MIAFNVSKTLDKGVDPFNLEIEFRIEQGEFVCLTGPSGSGKTSVLRLLAGLTKPDAGFIAMGNISWSDTISQVFIKPQKRNVGYVFQDYNLFPNMTVLENLKFAAKSKDLIDELIEVTELGDMIHRKPNGLSGGQKQRAALARAIVSKPDLLLLDEAFAALDRGIRAKMQEYVMLLHRDYGLTTIFVSHEVSEIMKMADRVIELDNGLISREGSPSELFADQTISGKFQFTGYVSDIKKEDVIYVISVLIGNQLVKVVADEEEIQAINVGDKVLVASKAFNPIIKKLN